MADVPAPQTNFLVPESKTWKDKWEEARLEEKRALRCRYESTLKEIEHKFNAEKAKITANLDMISKEIEFLENKENVVEVK